MRLKGSVGERGRNTSGDVTYVQILLADWLLAKGSPGIDIDGTVGPQTIGAIRAFQKANTAVVDGLVEPDRSTIKALEKAHIEVLRTSLKLSDQMQAVRQRMKSRQGEMPIGQSEPGSKVEAYLNFLRSML